MESRIVTVGIGGLFVISSFLGLFIMTDQACGAGPTYVSGSITSDTIWYLADSPYIVIGEVTVEPGFTLTIEPGVEVKFDGVYSIIVDGKLIADGTSIDKIRFTSNQTIPAKGDWYTVRLRTENNLIDYAEVEYATYGMFMTFYGGNNTISNTTIKYCKYDGIYIKNSDNNTISNCTVATNDRFGITIYESHKTRVDNSMIQNNNFFGINLNASTYTRICNCNVSYNDGKGILLYSNSHHTMISDCEIDWNNHIGIDLWGTSDNNIINTTVIGNNGIGIDFHSATQNQWIENCTIMDNEGTGIDLRGANYVDIIGCNVSENNGNGGIYSDSSVSCINISESEFWNNLAGNGIDFYGAIWVNITDSNFFANAGDGIGINGNYNQENNTIRNCTVAGNENNGIHFYAYNDDGGSYIHYNNISSCKIYSNNQNGIYFIAHIINHANVDSIIQNNNIFSNSIHSNIQNGVFLFSYCEEGIGCRYPKIRNNNIYSNTIFLNNQNGICFSSYAQGYMSFSFVQNNSIFLNTLYSNNQNGIYLYGFTQYSSFVQKNHVYLNTIYSNGKNGAYFHVHSPGDREYDIYLRNNSIHSNTIYSNNQIGIHFGANSDSFESSHYIENNNIHSNNIYQHIGGNSSFKDALDNKILYWATYGDAPWVEDTSIYFYDGDSAKSGNILDGQTSSIETTVLGPGTLYFYWKVSSQLYGDYLRFCIDDVWTNYISGEVDWHQQMYNISSGVHTLRWVYIKDNSFVVGADCGWIDKIKFTGHSPFSGILFSVTNPGAIWEESNIYNNTITSNTYGVVLSDITAHVIYTNNISWNNVGILLLQSTSNTFRYNTIEYNNRTGLNLTCHSSNNKIENNIISSGNQTGISISCDSNNNVLTRNDIMNNSGVGLRITGASGNQVNHNNFIDNDQNAFDSTIALNDWDDGAEGNYWSDYLGTDDDGDGFGEDPYVILGGGSRDWHPYINPLDTSPPYVISTSPADGEENVPVDTTISITFSKAMNTTAVEGAISISGGLFPIGFEWDIGNEIVTFSLSSNLASRTAYTVTITTDAKDILENWMEDTYMFSFTSADIEPPNISVTVPFHWETNVEIDADIVVTFSEPMQPSSVAYSCSPDPIGWLVSWSPDNMIATLSHNDFGSEISYTFQIASGKDLAGLNLVAGPVPNPWSFTTEDVLGPEIILTSPSDGLQNVSTTADIVVDFNEQMDRSSITYTCTLDPLGWSVIWTNNDMTSTFSHNEFTQKTLYTFEITGAKDTPGNALNPSAIPNPWSFTTTGDYTAPQIILTSPADNEVNVDLAKNIEVTFSEAMDISSLNYVCVPDPGGWSESWSNGDTVITFSHDPFAVGIAYTFHINTGKDISGNALAGGTVPNPWSFTTITGDLIAPKIISTSPQAKEVGINLDADITVTFSEPMNTSSLDYICIPDPGGWSGGWSNGDTVVTYSHDPFDYETIYNFYIIAGKDVLGNNLMPGPVPNPWSFTTVEDSTAPQIVSISPANNEIDVNLNSHVSVTFSEAMDTSSVSYICTPDPGGWFESWSSEGTVVTYLHDPFAPGTTYTFHITAGNDLSGNNLVSGPVPHSWSFTTISIESLTVTPSEVSIAVNGTVVLIAQAHDAHNNPISGITYTWSVNNDLGTVFSQNREIATFQGSSNSGTCMVYVSAGGKNATTVITITSEESDGIEPEESRPDDMDWISFLWLLIITACIVILVGILWKKGPEEGGKQPEKDATFEKTAEDNLVGKVASETKIPPPHPEETTGEGPDVTEVPTEGAPEGPDTPPEDSSLPPPPDWPDS